MKDVSRLGNKLLLSAAGDENRLGIADYTVADSGRVSVSAAELVALDAPNDTNEAVIYDIAAGGDRLFYVLTGNAPDSNSGDFTVLRYSPEGAFQEKMTITGFAEDAEAGFSIAADANGSMVLMGDNYVYSLPWQGAPANRQTVERAYFTCAASTSGGIVLSIHNIALDASPFFSIDPESGSMSRLTITNPVNPAEDVEGFKLVWGGSYSLCQGLNGEFISSSGKSYDLVLFGDNLNTASAYFDDLYPYIDADPELSRASFLPNLLESSAVNGELHQLWDQTAVNSLVGKRAYVGDGKWLTPADYLRIAEENEQVVSVFDSFMTREELLAYIARISISTFVDKENGTCSFDSKVFADLLGWCREMGQGIAANSGEVFYEPEEYILNPAFLTTPIEDTYIESWGDYEVYVGFPNGAMGYHYYSAFPGFGLSMAIPANSQNKDGAWAFIRERLSLDAQLNLGTVSALPVSYEALKRLAEASSTEAGQSALYELLERTRYAETYADSELQNIIVSDGLGFVNGDKSVEETVHTIQSKASIYVAERYG